MEATARAGRAEGEGGREREGGREQASERVHKQVDIQGGQGRECTCNCAHSIALEETNAFKISKLKYKFFVGQIDIVILLLNHGMAR